jgi:hypothetical protein
LTQEGEKNDLGDQAAGTIEVRAGAMNVHGRQKLRVSRDR